MAQPIRVRLDALAGDAFRRHGLPVSAGSKHKARPEAHKAYKPYTKKPKAQPPKALPPLSAAPLRISFANAATEAAVTSAGSSSDGGLPTSFAEAQRLAVGIVLKSFKSPRANLVELKVPPPYGAAWRPQRPQLFSDGACPSNGQGGKKAGAGLWDPGLKQGWAWVVPAPATNQRAELFGMLTAILRANEMLQESTTVEHVEIHSDSRYAIGCVGWAVGWATKGWCKADGQPVQNLDLVQAIHRAYRRNNTVSLHWVEGHAGGKSELTKGNENADSLASYAAAL